MKRRICVSCGSKIMKSAFHDPYLCRECEKEVKEEQRFAFLDG